MTRLGLNQRVHLAPPGVAWRGHQEDEAALLVALHNNCALRGRLDAQGGTAIRCYACPSCRMATDQRALNRLAFVAWLRWRLQREEEAHR